MQKLEDLYKAKEIDAKKLGFDLIIDKVSERDKFKAAKQILLGLAILYILTMIVYIFRPQSGSKLLEIIIVTFPPLATLILTAYFRDKTH